MTSAYPIAEAQTMLHELFEEASRHPVCIRDGEKILGYLVAPHPAEDWEAQIETAELLDTPEAMEALREACEGEARYHDLSALDEA